MDSALKLARARTAHIVKKAASYTNMTFFGRIQKCGDAKDNITAYLALTYTVKDSVPFLIGNGDRFGPLLFLMVCVQDVDPLDVRLLLHFVRLDTVHFGGVPTGKFHC